MIWDVLKIVAVLAAVACVIILWKIPPPDDV